MECINSISYSIVVNGEPSGNIKPSRGIRQSDPLSPYLFLLCSEDLNGSIKKAMYEGMMMRGFSLCENGPLISRLFFANNSLLFYKAELGGVQTIQDILTQYEVAFGLASEWRED